MPSSRPASSRRNVMPIRSLVTANSARLRVGISHCSPRSYSRGSIATNRPMTMIMNMLVSAPNALTA